MCPTIAMGDSEKAAGEEITNPTLLGLMPLSRRPDGERDPARYEPVSTDGRDSGRPTFHVMPHLPQVTLTHPLSHLMFFSQA